MLNGWFTIVAEAINFLILVGLLQRFLYKPILHAIDEREKGIAAQLAQAEAKTTEAKKDRDDFQHKNEVFDQERTALLKKATDEAEVERQRLLDQARKDADALRAKRQDALQAEQRNLNQEVIRWTRNQVFAIARKTLTDLAAPCLEERITDVFIARLRGLTGEAKGQMAAALIKQPCTALIRSAFELPVIQRAEIATAVKETFDPKITVQFQISPELVSGVELSANGQKLAWTIADYLATLEKSAAELVRVNGKSETSPKPASSIAEGYP